MNAPPQQKSWLRLRPSVSATWKNDSRPTLRMFVLIDAMDRASLIPHSKCCIKYYRLICLHTVSIAVEATAMQHTLELHQ